MTSKCEIDSDNTKRWYNSKGQYHRTDGPAVEWADGSKEWYFDGKRHRTDGPARDWANGSKSWFLLGNEYRDEKVFKVAADIFIALFPELTTTS